MGFTPREGSIPSSGTTYVFLRIRLLIFAIARCQNISTKIFAIGPIEQPNRALDRRGTEMHVALRRREILVARELLNGSCSRATHRQMRAERVAKDVRPLFFRLARRAARSTSVCIVRTSGSDPKPFRKKVGKVLLQFYEPVISARTSVIDNLAAIGGQHKTAAKRRNAAHERPRGQELEIRRADVSPKSVIDSTVLVSRERTRFTLQIWP